MNTKNTDQPGNTFFQDEEIHRPADLYQLLKNFPDTSPMPVLFAGHGSPMNAIEDNLFTRKFQELGQKLPIPAAILCISAHWETKGTWVTAMKNPKTIHDFGGFPEKLYQVNYPAPGQPELANGISQLTSDFKPIQPTQNWGLDHGSWSVIKHMYPNANIPVVELSLDYLMSGEEHLELAKQLSSIRRKGVLIIGSGNMVHNLRLVAWQYLETPGYAYEWAEESQQKLKKLIVEEQLKSLANYQKLGKASQLAIPTPDHYLPLLYALGVKQKEDEISFFNDQIVGGALSMTSLLIQTIHQ